MVVVDQIWCDGFIQRRVRDEATSNGGHDIYVTRKLSVLRMGQEIWDGEGKACEKFPSYFSLPNETEMQIQMQMQIKI